MERLRYKVALTFQPADSEQLEKLFSEARRYHGPTGNMLADGKEFDALAVPLNDSETLIIAPQKRASNDLTDLVTGSERGYQDLVRKQRRVRLLGLSTLGLMTLILFFVSSWVAIYLARGIATPDQGPCRSFQGDCARESHPSSHDGCRR
jgi:hypothetical protein